MTKGLRLLSKKRTSIPIDECFCTTGETVKQIKKELKALEIIKVKTVNVMYFKGSDTLEEYNNHHATWHKLTQEEFDLLEEVLL